MKKFFMLFGLMALFLQPTEAQFLQVGNSTLQNTIYGPVYRPNATSSLNFNNHVYLYDATELSDIPKGARIHRIDWHAGLGTGGMVGNNRFTIWMENTVQKNIAIVGNTFNIESAGMDQVYMSSSYQIPPNGGWIINVLDDALIYDGDNLKIAVAQEKRGTATGPINWYYTSAPGMAAGTISSIDPSNFNFSTFYSSNRPDIRIYYSIPFPNDAGIQEIEQPKSFCGNAPAPVVVRLTNFGNNVIDSVEVNWSIDNAPQPKTIWRIPLDTVGGFGQSSTPLYLGSYNFIPGRQYNVRAWTALPNGVIDTLNQNDTVEVTIQSSLKGTYIIGSSLAADYNTIDDALFDLRQVGLCGDVNFLIDSGTYIGNYEMSNIIGANNFKTTFQSASGNRDHVIITNNGSGEIFNINAPNVVFASLTFQKTNAPSGVEYLISFGDQSLNGVAVNCVFNNLSTSTSSNNRNVGLINSTNVRLILNKITGGYYGVYAFGAVGNRGLFNKVTQNSVEDFVNYGIFAQQQSYFEVRGNSLQGVRNTFGAHIYCRTGDNITLAENRISGPISAYGIFFDEIEGSSAEPNYIVNNAIGGKFLGTRGNAIYVVGREDTVVSPRNNREFVKVMHNSINVDVDPNASTFNNGAILINDFTSTARGIKGFDSVIVYNNSVVGYSSQATGVPPRYYPFYLNNARILASLRSNNNNFYFEGTNNVVSVAGSINYTSLTAWRTASGQDFQTVTGDPSYASATFLAPSGPLLNDKGRPTEIKIDQFSNPRSNSEPDIGAYEFDLSPIDLGILSLVRPVGGCESSNADSVEILILNYGTDSVWNFGVNYSLNNGPVASETIFDTLYRGDTLKHTFSTTVNIVTRGRYDLTVFTTVIGDGSNFNDTLHAEIINPTVSSYPYKEDFQSGLQALPSTWPDGWVAESTATMNWQIDQGASPTAGTGPNFDHTQGNTVGKYAVLDTRFAGTFATLYSPCVKVGALQDVGLSYWYHMFGPDMGNLFVEVLDSTGWHGIDTLIGQQQISSNDPWLERNLSLKKYKGQTIQVRFRGVRGPNFRSNMALDDIEFYDLPAADVGVLSIVDPITGCGKGSQEDITVEIYNYGSSIANNFLVGYSLDGGAPLIEFFRDTLLPGTSKNFTFAAKADLSVNKRYGLTAYTAMFAPPDAKNSNDTLKGYEFGHVRTITTFPYIEDFEGTSHGWEIGGLQDSWQLGTPAGITVSGPGSGNRSWITSLSTQYNALELSYVQSPCFDLSNLQAVRIRTLINYATFTNDGAALQYSIDSGRTWITAGKQNDPDGINWYNSNSMNDITVRNFFDNQTQWWSGRLNAGSQGWKQAELKLNSLAGQAHVIFRFAFGSDAFTMDDGFAFDLFKLEEPVEPVIKSLTKLSDTCSNMAFLVEAEIAAVYSRVDTANLHYDLTNTGIYTALQMIFNSTSMLYEATIPAGMSNVPINYFVSVIDSVGNSDTTELCTYVSDYLAVFAGNDTTILGGASVVLKANAAVAGGGGGSSLAITEMNLDAPSDMLEIQNVSSSSINVTGWKVAISDNYASINIANTIVKTLTGTMASGQIMYWDDNASSANYWGNNIFWNPGSFPTFTAWAIILDNNNKVVDFVPVNWPSTSIATFNVTIGGAPITLDPTDWVGNGANGSGAGGSIQRVGSSDNNDMNDFVFNTTLSTGQTNANLSLPFLGGGTFSWSDGTTVLSTADTLGVMPSSTTTYYVTVDDGKCSATDTVVVNVSGILRPDAGVSRMVNPIDGSTITFNSPIPVQIYIKNYGNTVISTPIPVEYTVNSVIEATENANIGVLQPGDSILYTFSKLWIAQAIGANTLCAYTKLANDADPSNDDECVNLVYTSLEELKKGKLVSKVYPVPADQELTLEFNSNLVKGSLEVYDAVGKRVQNRQLQGAIKGGRLTLNVAELSEGVYTFRIKDDNFYQNGSFIIAR